MVVGLGGYVSGPGGVAAWLARRPLLIHEQNAIAGFTNRCLARLAREVYTAFPGAFGSGVVAHQIGNPVRTDIASLPPPAVRFAYRSGAIRILVVGGSQGAARLNSVVPHALARLAGNIRVEVRHQAGAALGGGRAPRLRRRARARRKSHLSSTTWPKPTAGRTW